MTSPVRVVARRRLRREAGLGTLEYVGMVALAAVLVIAIALHAWGSDLAGMTSQAICSVTRAFSATSAPCGTPTPLTPYEQAVSGRYVAMGDSYSSGEGTSNYEPGTDFDDRDDAWPFNDDEEDHNRCRRSPDAYSSILSGNNDFAGGSTFVACSGAVTSDFENPNHNNTGEDPQFDALGDDVSLVTLTMGGNDLKFGKVVQDCIMNGESNVPFLDSCQEKHNKEIAETLPKIRQQLLDAYKKIHEKAPNARIVIVGYPQLFIDNPSDSYGNLLFAEDQVWMNEKAAELNAMLASAAAEAGAEFVDPTDTFRGHGIGSSDPWINDLDLSGPGMMAYDPGSFHPNAAGHAALAQLIQQQMEHPRP